MSKGLPILAIHSLTRSLQSTRNKVSKGGPTHIVTVIVTYRLNWPLGLFSEKGFKYLSIAYRGFDVVSY